MNIAVAAANRQAKRLTKLVSYSYRTYRMKNTYLNNRGSFGCLILANGRVISNVVGFENMTQADAYGDNGTINLNKG